MPEQDAGYLVLRRLESCLGVEPGTNGVASLLGLDVGRSRYAVGRLDRDQFGEQARRVAPVVLALPVGVRARDAAGRDRAAVDAERPQLLA